jgi:hypothetical protein
LLRATAGEWGKSRHEEMKTRERNHIYSQLAEICVELTGESEAGGDAAHGSRDKVVKIAVCRGSELEGSEADIVESFVVNAVGFVCVLDKLVDGESSVVGLNDGIRNFGGWYYAESVHDSIWVFFADLRDEESTHARASATTKRVGELEALKAIAALCLLSNHIKHRVYQFSSLSVVTLCPVIACTTLTCKPQRKPHE